MSGLRAASADVERAAAPWRLALPRGLRSGRAGEHLGRGLGNSVDFVDHRDYAVGDDLRRVDWRAYARTDKLMVRRYRDEVSPLVEVIVDLSASMAVTEAKAQALADLARAFWLWSVRHVGRVRFWARGGAALPCAEGGPDLPEPSGPGMGPWAPGRALSPGSLRYVVSDFLEPEDPTRGLRQVAAGASAFGVVQLLDPWERRPTVDGLTELRDCENESRLDVELSAERIAAYGQRLGQLIERVREAAVGVGGALALVDAGPLEAMIERGLLRGGVVQPVEGAA